MDNLITSLAAFLPRDRVAQICVGAPLAAEGVALIADISGFTPLTERLARELSPARGAEELTRALNGVFAPLIGEARRFGGSVIKFGGDALIVWFPRQPQGRRATLIRRSLAAAAGMQAAIGRHGCVATPAGAFTLTMKIGMAYGPALRLRLGDPTLGYEDVIGGATLDRMAEAEHHAGPGEIILDPAGISGVADLALVHEDRGGLLVVGGPRCRVAPARHQQAASADGGAELAEALRPYLPAEVFDALRDGRAQPAELKPVVSIFVQFQGIVYDDAALATPRLAAYFAAAQATAARYGGRVNRLITGDKGSLLHVIFGAPSAVEEQDRRAALCCLELRRAAGELGFISAQRIGAAAGRAFAGPVGSPARRDYTVMGDTINLSARLMQSAAAGQIVLDGTLAARLADDFALEDLGAAMLKGKADPVARLALLGQAATPRPAARVYGRDLELAALRRQFDLLAGGHGGVAVLIGDLGMGKSHLLAALRASADLGGADGAPLWAGAAAAGYGQPRSGALLAAALRELLGVESADDPAAGLDAALADLLGERAGASALPYLARFLGLPMGEAQARDLAALAGESLRWRVFELLGEVVRAACRHRPLALALDDLQWADPTSLELLESLLPLTSELPLLLILASRPDTGSRAWAILGSGAGDWGSEADKPKREAAGCTPIPDPRSPIPGALRVDLGRLDETSALAVVAQHAPGLGAAARAKLAERGQGNPLFLVELARTAAAGGNPAELPDSVQGLLLAQIDRLPGELRETLQLAAVLGPSFAPRLLAAMAGPGGAVDARLEALETAGFLLRVGEGYGFRHTLIRESAYSALLYERRRGHHGVAAAVIERLYPTQLAERSGELAEHYERAENLGAAARYHGQSADGARLLYANAEAEVGYRHVLALLERCGSDDGMRARTYLKLAQVQMNAGNYAAAQELYDLAFGLLEMEEAQRPARVARRAPVFRMGAYEPETLDPGLLKSTAGLEILCSMFEGLVELDDDFNVVPACARRWRIEDSGRRYIFDLRPGLCWSDGAALTAHDFVYAWRRNLDPRTGASLASLLDLICRAAEFHDHRSPQSELGVRAINDLTLEVTLDAPSGYFLSVITALIAMPQPAHLVARLGPAWANPANIVCNGPFVLHSWQRGRGLRLKPNRYYRASHEVKLDQVHLHFCAPRDEWARRDTLDLYRVVDRDAPPADHARQVTLSYLATYFLVFACGSAPTNSLPLRRALAMCIDRERLVRDAWGGMQEAATGGIIPAGMPGYSPGLGGSFDPAAAHAIMADRAERTPIILASTMGFGQTPRFIQRAWSALSGLSVQVVEDVPIDQLLAGLHAGDYHVALMGWEAEYPDPNSFLHTLFYSGSPVNYFGWSNPAYDSLVDQASRHTDQATRMALYHQAERILVADEVALVPLYYERMQAILASTFQIAQGSHLIRGGRIKLKQIVPTRWR